MIPFVIITSLIICGFMWPIAGVIRSDLHGYSERRIRIIQMLCIFWPIGIPYFLFWAGKKFGLWFVESIKIIFDKESQNK